AGAGVAASAIASSATAQTSAPVRWRLATSWPKSLDALLRQCRGHVSTRGTTNRQEIPDPALRWGRNRAAAASLGCDAKRHSRVRPHAHLVLYRQKSRGRVRFRARLRTQYSPAAGLDELRRRTGAHPRVVEEGRNPPRSLRQCGRADGWFLPQ